MIITLTMNPAIDHTVSIPDFKVNHVNRITESRYDAAGKGINVSKVVKGLGGRTKVFAFLGGDTGDYIKKSLVEEKISCIAIETSEPTRTNLKIVDPDSKTYTDINQTGAYVSEDQLALFRKQVFNYLSSQSLVVLTGSLPPGVPVTIYQELISDIQAIGAVAVLDADGEAFEHGLKSGPKIIKPNIHELELYVGRKLDTEDEVVQAAKELLAFGTELIAVSMGAEGALFITNNCVYRAHGLKVSVKGTVGAGDAMLAAICYGRDKNLPIEETIRLAIATSAAKVMVEGTKSPDFDTIYDLKKQVKISVL
ncbi:MULTISPECIES: 1-phosphofructokinase [unclassified Fusibacter]|uniref:1-phosphofructokinase n=1 Tax=unclassified Fusibacter TaxID=2624464 RepID=UPI001012F16B|nr:MULTISPECIES: 1-phosphofructokinase [unclassified Fusibacter]MCK8058584.1 1-phosphofructokinase [Fusibacter sp. A2]NPE22646.1 1-phosphofructokinase [Fusibacter sp. A1]RXV60210.1 1-phosphofructokinase [Fusibacter sp. A1]